jgi:hypothetical protein
VYSLTRGRCLGLTFGSWNNLIGAVLRDGPAGLGAGSEVLLVAVGPIGSLGTSLVGFLDTSTWVLLVAVDAVSLFSEDLLNSLGLMAEVAFEARRCARSPGTVDRFGTVDDFIRLEAWDVEELSPASLRGRSGPLFLDAAASLAASPG